VVKVQSRGNGSDNVLIGPPVSPHNGVVVQVEGPIALLFTTSPEPTRAKIRPTRRDRSLFVDILPKSLNIRAMVFKPLICTLPGAEAASVARYSSVSAEIEYEDFLTLLACEFKSSGKIVCSHSSCSFLAEGCGQEHGEPFTAYRALLSIP
jgi:hypothetical protein